MAPARPKVTAHPPRRRPPRPSCPASTQRFRWIWAGPPAAPYRLARRLSSAAALARFVTFNLNGINLATIAGGDDLSAVAFNLVQWAGSRGHLSDLILAAAAETPRNADLQALAARVRGSADEAAHREGLSSIVRGPWSVVRRLRFDARAGSRVQ